MASKPKCLNHLWLYLHYPYFMNLFALSVSYEHYIYVVDLKNERPLNFLSFPYYFKAELVHSVLLSFLAWRNVTTVVVLGLIAAKTRCRVVQI